MLKRKTANLVGYGILAAVAVALGYIVFCGRGYTVDKFRPGDEMKISKGRVDLICIGLMHYRRISGSFPGNGLNLSTEFAQAGIRLGLQSSPPEDYWGLEIGYTIAGDEVRVISAGPDKIFGTKDDIVRGFTWTGEDTYRNDNLYNFYFGLPREHPRSK